MSYRDSITAFIRRDAKPVEKYSHQPRLYKLALNIAVAGNQTFDDDVLFAAAWLHDIGVFVGHRPEEVTALASWNNVTYAVGEAPALLREFGFPEEKIPPVLSAIEHHQPSGRPTNVEGILLRDADILEQLGAIAVLRTVCKIGRDTRFSTFFDAVKSLRHALETLPSQIALPTTCVFAVPKVAALREFLAAVDAESLDELS
jgi:uncharacterized protein